MIWDQAGGQHSLCIRNRLHCARDIAIDLTVSVSRQRHTLGLRGKQNALPALRHINDYAFRRNIGAVQQYDRQPADGFGQQIPRIDQRAKVKHICIRFYRNVRINRLRFSFLQKCPHDARKQQCDRKGNERGAQRQCTDDGTVHSHRSSREQCNAHDGAADHRRRQQHAKQNGQHRRAFFVHWEGKQPEGCKLNRKPTHRRPYKQRQKRIHRTAEGKQGQRPEPRPRTRQCGCQQKHA